VEGIPFKQWGFRHLIVLDCIPRFPQRDGRVLKGSESFEKSMLVLIEDPFLFLAFAMQGLVPRCWAAGWRITWLEVDWRVVPGTGYST
jgi:hypothetical protein